MELVDTTLPPQDDPSTGSVPQPPPRPGPGLRPAMVVIGLAALILVLLAVSAVITGGGNAARKGPPPSASPTKVRGSSLLAVPAGKLLRSIESPGLPPNNIVRSVYVPEGSVLVSAGRTVAGSSQYDQQVVLSVDASQAAVIGFFRAVLPARNWSVFSTGPALRRPRTIEVLAKQAGDDGWYWEIGALVTPTTFGSAGPTAAAGPAAATGTTRFTIRLYQISDQQ